jgi:Protein kinase domain
MPAVHNPCMPELQPGTEIAGCRIEAVAGRGGMGVIYRATEVHLGRPVAVKLITAERAEEEAFRTRFERESRLTASIDHPNVIPVYAAGEEDGVLYLVMRYVAGTDLRALLKEEGRLPPERAARIVGQVAAGLDAAHAAGLVHRDVKPANVLIADGGHVYLSDFGIVRAVDAETRLTDSGEWVGSVDFMAPEHLQGRPTDARADVYSLGCLLYTALTGESPFRRDTVAATITAHLHERPPRPSQTPGVPEPFDRVIARALAKDPDDRYPSAGDLGRAALAAARGEPVTESERSVAVGPAAPSTNGHVAPPTALTVAEPTAHTRAQTRVQAEEETTVLPPRKRRRRALAGLFVGIAAAGTAVALIGNPGAGDGADKARAPLSEDEVRDVAQDFAQAYQDEDGTALRRLLTPGVARVLPSGVARGRARVVREYESQFRAQETEGYSLDDLAIQGGRAGRASGSYTVDRKDKQPIEGRIVLGMVRDRGQPRIGLIAVTPNS